MPINANQLVNIIPRVINPGAGTLEINGLFLTESDYIPTNVRMLSFSSPEAVAEYFGDGTDEAVAAQKYFLGFDNSQKKPNEVLFGRFINAPAAAYLRGNAVNATVAALKQVTDGTLGVDINGVATTLTGLDFSSANSYSEIAVIIETSIKAYTDGGEAYTAATVAYNSHFNAFIITSGTTGAGTDIQTFTGATAPLLALDANSGAITSVGADAETLTQAMESMILTSTNWVSFTTLFALENQQRIQLAQWANGKGVRYLYVFWGEDADLAANDNNTTNIGSQLRALNISSVAGVFGDMELAAMTLGMGASIDYTRTQGAITYAYKGQSGQRITVNDSELAVRLDGRGANYYGNYASANEYFYFYQRGQMYGRYGFIDTYINQVWFNDRLQLALLVMLQNTNRLPYTPFGYATIRVTLQDAINDAINAGVIDRGVNLNLQQQAQVDREAGLEIHNDLLTDGYYLQIKDPGAIIRAGRETPICNLWYTYGGSIHKIELANTVVL